MKSYRNCFRNTWIALLGGAMLFASCKKDGPKSSDCEITSFSVNAQRWDINGANITHSYPPETEDALFTPTINLSPGATVSPSASVPQNFFTADGVAYTVTAEDGVTGRTYIARAVRIGCDIVSFSVDGVNWEVNGTDITHTYPPETVEAPLAPAIALSPGASVSPPTGEAQNLFREDGVAYIVTAEDGVTKKTYTAKATRTKYAECRIEQFSVEGTDWNIDDEAGLVSYTYPEGTEEGLLTPVITLSPGASINPPIEGALNFFTVQGLTYTVTSEDGASTKTYTVMARSQSACNILSFSAGGIGWDINGTDITGSYPPETTETQFTPVIVLSPGASVNPPADQAHNFFTAQGVTYTVTAEDGTSTKTYTAKASIHGDDNGSTGNCTWAISGTSGYNTITVSGNGAMADYSIATLPYWHQYSNRVKNVVIEEGVSAVGVYAFYEYSGLTSITIPNSVTDIKSTAFASCFGLTEINFGNSLKSIGSYAFSYCRNLISVNIPNSVETVGNNVFVGCDNLTSVVIGNSVRTVGEEAFFNCNKISSLTIGSSVTTIGKEAFYYCVGLKTVTNLNPVPQTINRDVFNEIPDLSQITLRVPPSSVDAYGRADVWKEFRIVANY